MRLGARPVVEPVSDPVVETANETVRYPVQVDIEAVVAGVARRHYERERDRVGRAGSLWPPWAEVHGSHQERWREQVRVPVTDVLAELVSQGAAHWQVSL